MSCDFPGVPLLSGLVENASLYSAKVSCSSQYDNRWAIAELRTAELLSRIQPNGHSEKRRKAVADYVKRLIHRCFDCEVFTFGSVPLKTYLPDGDIDLTAFSGHQHLRDNWANDVQSILKDEERREDAEFCVREVQYIHAEVKIVKCLVENIVVDVSFNQLGGLSALCFLEEVDRLIERDHLFKRSIILVKAWCYYESRLLGAHHGLISTYALETLVLYIFNIFHTTLRGPLEVLFIFLDYFSNFDWKRYCVSLWGPVPLSSIPDLSAEPPLRDGRKVLLSKDFLEACSKAYGVASKGEDAQAQSFSEKYLNVVDHLRTSNNLGRSVSKANFFRIRSAFNLGARKMAKMFESSEEDFVKHLDNFFANTWERHQSGQRPDAPASSFPPYQNFDLKDQSLNGIAGDASDILVRTKDQDSKGLEVVGESVEDLGTKGREGILDSSSSVEEVLNFSERFCNSEPQAADGKKNKPVRTVKKAHAQSPIRWSTTEDVSDTEMVKDSRLVGDAHDLAVDQMQSLSLESKPLNVYQDVSSDLKHSETSDALIKMTHAQTWDDPACRGGWNCKVKSECLSNPTRTEVWCEGEGQGQGFSPGQVSVSGTASSLRTKGLKVNKTSAKVPHEFVNLEPSEHVIVADPHPLNLPSYVMLPSSTTFRPPAFITSSPVGPDMGKPSNSIADSSLNAVMPSLSPAVAVQIPQGPSPPVLSSYLGVHSFAANPAVDVPQTPFHPENLRDVDQASHLWQPEQEQLQQLQPVQPWCYSSTSSSALLPPPQVSSFELDRPEADGTSKSAGAPGKDGVSRGNSAMKSGRTKGTLKEHKVRNKGPSMIPNISVDEGLSEPSSSVFAKEEIADAHAVLKREDIPFQEAEGSVKALPVLLSGGLGYTTLGPGVFHHSGSRLSTSDMQKLPNHLSDNVQAMDSRTAGGMGAGPAVAPVVIADTVQSPGMPGPPLENSQEGLLTNQVTQGASPVYFLPGSFPTVSYYNPFYAAILPSDNGPANDAGPEMGLFVSHEHDSVNLLEGDQGGKVTCQVSDDIIVGPNASAATVASHYTRGSAEEGAPETSLDLLSSDFLSHRCNLEFGRWCQDPTMHSVALSPHQMPKYVQTNYFWEGLHRPIQGSFNTFSQVPNSLIPGLPYMQTFGHIHGNLFPGQGAFGMGDGRKHQSGTGTFLPSRHGLYRDMHSSGVRYQQAAHLDQRSSGSMGSSRQRGIAHALNGTDSTHVRSDRRMGEGKLGDRNAWWKSPNILPGYSPVTPTFVPAASSFGPFTGFTAVNMVGGSSFEPGPIVSLPSANSSGRVLPLVVGQLEFGSLGPVQVGTMPEESSLAQGVGAVQHGRFHTGLTGSDAFTSFSDTDLKQTLLKTQQR